MSDQADNLLDELAERIDAVKLEHPTRVAIDGVDAAGKTMLADGLVARIEALGRHVIRASADGFHNPARLRTVRGTLSPEGYYSDSFDYPQMVSALLRPLGPGGDLIYRTAVFDHRTDRAVVVAPGVASPAAVLLFDGVFLLRPELRPYWDFSVFVRAGFRVTLPRALKRDLALFGNVEGVRERYERRYIPGQMLYIAEAAPESHATVVVDNNDPEAPFFS